MTADIARLVLELGQNAIEAGAARVVICLEQTPAGARTVQVLDDGPGFSPAALCRGTEEGFTSAARPGAGRGLALARRTAQRRSLSNAPDGGALVRAWLSPAVCWGDVSGAAAALAQNTAGTAIALEVETPAGTAGFLLEPGQTPKELQRLRRQMDAALAAALL